VDGVSILHIANFGGPCTKRSTFDFLREEIRVRQSFYRGVLRLHPKSSKGKREIRMGYLVDDLRRVCTGDLKNFVFKIRTAKVGPGSEVLP